MDWMKLVHGATPQTPPAGLATGDEIRVWYRILEQGKERLGQFEGLVIRSRGSGPSQTFTVRRVTHGEGVERVFPMDAKIVSRIEVLRKGRVKRSRLYFLRTVVGKTRLGSADAEAQAGAPPETVPVVPAPADAEVATGSTSATKPVESPPTGS